MLSISIASAQGFSIDLSTLTISIPATRVRPIKLDYLALEMADQLDHVVKEPFGIIIESTMCGFNIDSYRLLDFHSAFPEIPVPTGEHQLKDIGIFLDSQGIDIVIDATASVVFLIQRKLHNNQEWPMNHALDGERYSIVDATKCRDILAYYGNDDTIADSRFLSSPLFYKTLADIDFSKATSVRHLVAAIAINYSQAARRGAVIEISPSPSRSLHDLRIWRSKPSWIAVATCGSSILNHPESFFTITSK